MISQQEMDAWTETAARSTTMANELGTSAEVAEGDATLTALLKDRSEDYRVDAAYALAVASTMSRAIVERETPF